MICKNCNTENPADALHCKNCGNLLDDRPVCPKCGEKNPEDATFCVKCGMRLDGKTVCPACGTLHEGNFCPQCGAAAPNVKKRNSGTFAHASAGNWRKIIELCGGIFAMCAVFAVLLCTFLLGLKSDMLGISENIYYYFGKAYTDISDALGAYSSYTPTFEASVYLPAVCNTVIAAGTIVSVLSLSILASVRYGLKVSGKSDKDYAKFAIGAVMAFVLGCALFATVSGMTVSARADGYSSSANIALNGAGVAGIVCGVIFLAIFLACRVSINGKALFTKQNIMHECFTLGALVLLAIVAAFAVKPGFFTNFTSNYVRGDIGINFFAAGQAISEYDMVGKFALAVVTQFVQIALVVLAVVAIFTRMTNLFSKKQNSGLALSISLVAVAVVYLVLAIVTMNLCTETVINYMSDFVEFNWDEATLNFAFPIVTLVFALACLAASITHTVLRRKLK